MRSPRLSATLFLVAALVGTGCGRSGGDDAGFETTNDQVPMKISVTLRGEREVTVRERTVLSRFIRIGEGSGVKELQPMLGVQPEEPILEGDVRVLPGLAIVPYKGNGSYTIETGAPSDDHQGGADPAAVAGAVKSSVRVEWWPVDGEPYEYQRRAKPCTVEIEDNGMRGRLRCPDITHEAPGGPHFSVDFRWEKA